MINKSLILVPMSLFVSAFADITLNMSEIAQILLKKLGIYMGAPERSVYVHSCPCHSS